MRRQTGVLHARHATSPKEGTDILSDNENTLTVADEPDTSATVVDQSEGGDVCDMSTRRADGHLVTPPTDASRAAVTPPVSRIAGAVRTALLDPSKVSGMFWLGGAGAVGSALVLAHFTRTRFHQTATLGALCGLCALVRLCFGGRLARWTLHVDVSVAVGIATLLAVFGASRGVPFADLYVWVAIYVALYFRGWSLLAYLVAMGVGDAVALLVGPATPEPVVSWLGTLGTMAVAMLVVHGLLTVLWTTAREDPLTGLANRRWWAERLDEELVRSARSGEPVSVVVADLDAFKALNDRAGHAAGDRVLRELASAWRGVTRTGGDFIARLGGDEFGILAAGLGDDGPVILTHRLASALPSGVQCSFGWATWNRSETAHELVTRADEEMYRTKATRRRRRA